MYVGVDDGWMTLYISLKKLIIFWWYWINWWEYLSGIAIKNSHVPEECIIFGCQLNMNAMQVVNFCILYTKYYYMFIQCLFNKNELDLYVCLAQVKLALEVEYNICKNSNKEKDFHKFKFVYDNI